MASSYWKNVERSVVKLFGVQRLCRGQDFGASMPDTTPHPIFSIEIKARKKVPAAIVKCCGSVLPKTNKFISEAILQAQGYYPGKIPIAVIHEKNKNILKSYVCLYSGDAIWLGIKNSLPIGIFVIDLKSFLSYLPNQRQ